METQVNLPVVLVNREGLYVVIAVLGVSILACACVLAYSYSNYAVLKKNAEEVRSYLSSGVQLPVLDEGSKSRAVVGTRVENGRNVSKKVAVLLPPANSSSDVSTSGTNESHAIVARQELGRGSLPA